MTPQPTIALASAIVSAFGFRISDFGFLSDFGFRISDLSISPLLAQVKLPTPAGSDLMIWLGCLAFVMMFVNQALKIKNSLFPSKESNTIYPQPLEIRQFADLVTEKDCKVRHQTTEEQIKELRSMRIDDIKVAGSSREKMYAAIKEVRSELAAAHDATRRDMNKGFQDIERAIGQLEGKIDRQ